MSPSSIGSIKIIIVIEGQLSTQGFFFLAKNEKILLTAIYNPIFFWGISFCSLNSDDKYKSFMYSKT